MRISDWSSDVCSSDLFYAQQGFSEALALGVRAEYFKRKDVMEGGVTVEGASTIGLTLSANIKAGPLTLIPEFRLDQASEQVFYKSDLSPMKNARSEERRVGKECVSSCRFGWEP